MLGKNDWELLGRQIQRLYEASDLEAFPSRVLEAMAPLIATDISCVTQVAPATSWASNVSDRPDDDVAALLPVFAEFQHEHPRLVDFEATGREDAVTISDYVSKKAWLETDLYNAFYRPLGLGDQICVVFKATTDIAMAIVSNRARRTYTDRDRARLSALLPHVKIAYRNAQTFSRLQEDAQAVVDVAGRSYLRVDREGRVLTTGRRAGVLLARYLSERETPKARLRGRLLAWLRDQVGDRAADRVCRELVLPGPSGALEVRLIESAHHDDWLLVLQENEGRAPGALEAQVATLPKRTQEVLRHLLAGDSEKQVAAKLEISRHTVHDHVKRIHRHFGVAARSELLALFIARQTSGNG